MSSEPTKTPSRRRLLVIALAALTIAGGVAAYGIIQRAQSAAQVAQWTDQQAIPTVALANLQRGPGIRKLTLPGTIQAYYRAAIYARVSGYLQSWRADIGAHVKAGQLLASIDIPDLDQQFAQAKADLATFRRKNCRSKSLI
jgi:multidrug efflux pump subunit AcrA (membrane-fusion protein)